MNRKHKHSIALSVMLISLLFPLESVVSNPTKSAPISSEIILPEPTLSVHVQDSINKMPSNLKPLKNQSPMVIKLRGSPQGTVLQIYSHALMKLALEKTKAEYGSYVLETYEVTYANLSRSLRIVKENKIKNYFMESSLTNKHIDKLTGLKDDMTYIHFPNSLGVYGYRVCFTSKGNENRLNAAKDIATLKTLTIGQGLNWMDAEILANNDFIVTQHKTEYLFPMVAANRFDMFCTGISQLKEGWRDNRHIKNLTYNKTFALYYPMPRVFWTNRNNVVAIKRITKGLKIAYNDGSLLALWRKVYQDSINYSDLKGRKIFTIENNDLLDNIKKMDSYFFNALSL